MCSAKEIAEIYRRAAQAGKFAEESTNPVKKREFNEIERKWLQIARECKCNSENAQKPSRRRPHRPRRMR